MPQKIPPSELWQEFIGIFAQLGLSPDKPLDAYKLAFWLFVCLRRTRSQGKASAAPKRPGRKATDPVMDAIILTAVEFAKHEGDKRGVEHIIRDLARANGWPSDKKAIKTKVRRYRYARKQGSEINKRMVAAMRPHLPFFRRRVQQVQELEKAGLSPDEIKVATPRIDALGAASAGSRS